MVFRRLMIEGALWICSGSLPSLSSAQHKCVMRLPKAGEESSERVGRTNREPHTEPRIVIPTSQSGKPCNIWDIGYSTLKSIASVVGQNHPSLKTSQVPSNKI